MATTTRLRSGHTLEPPYSNHFDFYSNFGKNCCFSFVCIRVCPPFFRLSLTQQFVRLNKSQLIADYISYELIISTVVLFTQVGPASKRASNHYIYTVYHTFGIMSYDQRTNAKWRLRLITYLQFSSSPICFGREHRGMYIMHFECVTRCTSIIVIQV